MIGAFQAGVICTSNTNLVVNGDFRSNVAGWTPGILQGSVSSILAHDTTVFISGGLKISHFGYPSAGQSITGLVIGATYKLSGKMYSDTAYRGSIICGYAINNNFSSITVNDEANTILNKTVKFVAPATSMTVWAAKVRPSSGWAGGDFYVTDISLVMV